MKMANLPPVKLEIHATWFNLLLALLHEHAESNPYKEYRQMAKRLADKFMAYGAPFTDKDGAPCVDLRMYPAEGGNAIWLLLLTLCSYWEPDRHYRTELKDAKKE